jgi:hypothetical protein
MTREEQITMQAIQRLERKIPDMTLRDLFAMSALNGILCSGTYHNASLDHKVKQSWELADAMLRARGE